MAETNQELTQQYYDRTQTALAALSAQLASLKEGPSSKDGVDKLAVEVAKLRKDLTDAITFLPSYDQRQFDQQIKKVEGELEAARAAMVPKTKFAFKRKAPQKPASPSPPSVPQSSSAPAPTTAGALAPISPDPATTGLTISGHSRSYLTRSSLSSPWNTPSDLTISDLDSCIVNLVSSESNPSPLDAGADASQTPHFTALHVRNLSNTVLILPAIGGSALLHDMRNCVIALGSHQFRMHTSSSVDVYISIGSNPIIEHCSSIRFADYPVALRPPGSEANGESKFLSVQDFSHIRPTPSPNWSALPVEGAVRADGWPLSVPESVQDTLLALLPPS